MITEDYVSFETAKLLKEKGFDEPVTELNRLLFKEGEKPVLEITHQKAMKWLRKKYNIHIEPRYFPMPNIYRYVIIHSPVTIKNIDSHPQYFNSYEEAVEAALKYSLENLI